MAEFRSVNQSDLSGGIDARSSENLIGDTYSEDLLNTEVIEKSLRKRKGYQGYAGNLPIRATSATYTTATGGDNGTWTFAFDSNLNFNGLRNTPLMVYGRVGKNTSGVEVTAGTEVSNFDSDSDAWILYSTSSVDQREAGAVGSGTIVKTAAQSGLTTEEAYVGLHRSKSVVNLNNCWGMADSVVINKSTHEVTIGYSWPGPAGTSFFQHVTEHKDGDTDSETVDGVTISTSLLTLENGTDFATLSTPYRYIVRCYEDDATDYTLVHPDSVVVDSSSGDVTITGGATQSSITADVIILKVDSDNVQEIAVAGGSTGTFTLTDVGPFLNFALYTVSGTSLTECLPDTVGYNEATDIHTVTVTNSTVSDLTFQIVWEEIALPNFSITVDEGDADVSDVPSSGADHVFNDPQITVYGLSHEDVYGPSKDGKEGWVNRIDTYRTSEESRLITALGGNLFAARGYEEDADEDGTTNQTDMKMGVGFPNAFAAVSGSTSLSPALRKATETPLRTRGYITGTNVNDDYTVSLESIVWQSGNTVRYTLSIEGPVVSTTIKNGIISATLNQEDYLTVTNLGYAKLNGSFRITDLNTSVVGTSLWVEVENLNVDDDTFDVTSGAGGRAGIFTDQVSYAANAPFSPGDIPATSVITNSLTALTCDGTVVMWDGVLTEERLPSTLVFPISRTSSLIPLRNSGGTATTDNCLKGDMVSLTGYERLFRIDHINTEADASITSISGSGTLATVTVTSSAHLSPGQKVLLVNSGRYSGEQTIDDIPNNTQLQFVSTLTDSGETGTLLGETIELDEDILWTDDPENAKTLRVDKRWIPIEAPVSTGSLLPTTYERHFDANSYTAQPFLQSAIVNDNMYLLNGDDEVMKFDGTNIYRAGIFPWQPAVFITPDYAASNKIKFDKFTSWDVHATGGVTTAPKKFKLADPEDEKYFNPNDIIYHDGVTYTVSTTSLEPATNDQYVLVEFLEGDTMSTDDTEDLVSASKVHYYFRVIALDANKNILGCASTGYKTYSTSVFANASIKIKMVGFPDWDIYDYDRLIVEIYRSTDSGASINSIDPVTGAVSSTFRRVGSVPMEYDGLDPYILFEDTKNNAEVVDRKDIIGLNVGLSGDDIASQTQQPLRAKYIQALSSKLLLGNIKDYATMDIILDTKSSGVAITPAVLAASGEKFWSFRRDGSATGAISSTDMVDEVRYEMVDGATAANVRAIDTSKVIVVAGTSFKFTVASMATTPDVGDWIYAFYNDKLGLAGANISQGDSLDLCGWWQVSAADATSVTVSYSGVKGGTFDNTDDVDGSDVITVTGHGFSSGEAVAFSAADGAVSVTGLAEDTVYYAVSLSANTLSVAATAANAVASTPTVISIAAVAGNEATYLHPVPPDTLCLATDPTDIPVYVGEDDENYRISLNEVPTGQPTLVTWSLRLSNAINCSMRAVNKSISGMSTFVPWLVAEGDSRFGGGEIRISQPRSVTTPFGMRLDSAAGDSFLIFVDRSRRGNAVEVQAVEKKFPSRLLVSSQANFPENFHNPTVINALADSVSAIDVNASDGQEITGMIPFFGVSTQSDAQKESRLAVFKENSIYIVDILSRDVTKINSHGIGCTAPYSLAQTKDGVIFANEAGFYKLTFGLQVVYLGRLIERSWQDRVNRDQLEIVQGTSFAIGNQYKASVPVLEETSNSEVFVYDYSKDVNVDGASGGSWSRFDNHPATGWANLDKDAYFSSTCGRVFSLRRAGDVSDYRDDDAAINWEVTLRALHFGDPASRKLIASIMTDFRVLADASGTKMYTSDDLSGEFVQTDAFSIDDTGLNKVVTIRSSTEKRRVVYIQLKYTNSTKDEPVELAGYSVRVKLLSHKGIREAADT